MIITPYHEEHAEDIISAIGQDPQWQMFTTEEMVETYRAALQRSITYVCYKDASFCGFIRAIHDEGLGVYISELFVIPSRRNHGIGHSLLEQVKSEYAMLTVYALSDEDAYYEKKGYKKIGSVFEL